MKGISCKKILAAVLSAAMLCTSASTVSAVNVVSLATANTKAAADDGIIFSSGFEDGEGVDSFTGRKGVEVIEATTEDSFSGDYSMKVSGRESGWNGPQLLLDEICQPNTEYYVSAAVKTAWYNDVKISWEYTDTEGERHYNNIVSGTSNGDWVELAETKFSFTEDMTKVYVYVECGDTADLYVDDFVLKSAPIIPIQEDIPSLCDVYSSYFKVGTAIMTQNLASPSFMDLVEKHFNDSITAGNEMKPENLLDKAACLEMAEAGDDTDPQVTLSVARSILNYCRDTNTPMRGHVLVWHSQTPDWFFKENYADDGEWVSKEKMLVRMENYIKNVFAALEEEYPDVNIYAWDVVNEAWLDGGTPRTAGEQGANGSDNSAWVKVFGDNSFIKPAFEYARKYAPEGTLLYYNDFNEYMPQKTAAIVAMAEELKAEGLIDGIGCQSHLASNAGSDAFPAVNVYEKAIAAFVETGLDVQITELDATITKNQPTEANLEAHAQYYSDILDVLVKYSDNISAVILWGVTDDQSWRSWGYPLLFDKDYQAKPAYYSIIDGLEVPDVTTTTTTTTTTTSETTTTTTTAPIEPDTGSSLVTVSGVIESMDESGYIVIDGTNYFFVTESYNTVVESGAGVGDTITIVGYKKNSADTFELVSSVEVTFADILYGDADGDGEVGISDVVLVMCHASNKEKYPLTDRQIKCADVYQAGDGVGASDALSIQKKLAQILTALPESYV